MIHRCCPYAVLHTAMWFSVVAARMAGERSRQCINTFTKNLDGSAEAQRQAKSRQRCCSWVVKCPPHGGVAPEGISYKF